MADYYDEFMNFDTFIARDMMSLIYKIGAALITILSALLLIVGMFIPTAWAGLIMGPVLFVLGNLLWRLICETFAVIFKINDSLKSIDSKLKKEE